MTKRGKLHDPERMYGYWREAGGNDQEAIRLVKAAGDKTMPTAKATWAKYAVEFKWQERLRNESRVDFEKYHAERQANVQQTLDKMAEGFEMLAGAFLQMFEKEFAVMRSGLPLEGAQMKRLLKFFGSMESIDRYFRMYLRTQGLPERITKVSVTETPTMDYDALEGHPKPKTLDEAKKMAAESVDDEK